MGFTVLKSGKPAFISYKIIILKLVSCQNSKQNGSTPVYQVLTSERRYGKNGKTAPVCQILTLQQINLEKNGFHSLKERQISFHTI